MKYQRNKLSVAQEEQNLARVLQQLLVVAEQEIVDETWLVTFRSALTYLLAAHLELNPSWDHRGRWIDDVELSLSFPETGTVQGTGKMWCGHRGNPSAALISVDLQARLQLLSSDVKPGVRYNITFVSEGITFSLNRTDP